MPRTDRRGETVMRWATRVLVLFCVLGLSQALWDNWRERSQVRECHRLQRKLQQNLDNLGSTNVDATMDEIFGRMIGAGLVVGQMGKAASGAPAVISLDVEDPGNGAGSYRNFVLMAGSRMVGCTVHGSPFVGAP